MPDTIRIFLYICFGMNAILYLTKECKKLQKNEFFILFQSFILIAVIWLIAKA